MTRAWAVTSYVNHGYDHVPDFYEVSQFRDRFNRPDIVALVLKTLDVDEAVRRAYQVHGFLCLDLERRPRKDFLLLCRLRRDQLSRLPQLGLFEVDNGHCKLILQPQHDHKRAPNGPCCAGNKRTWQRRRESLCHRSNGWKQSTAI
jgi:hypothetical protein